jgi:hypothetical protein
MYSRAHRGSLSILEDRISALIANQIHCSGISTATPAPISSRCTPRRWRTPKRCLMLRNAGRSHYRFPAPAPSAEAFAQPRQLGRFGLEHRIRYRSGPAGRHARRRSSNHSNPCRLRRNEERWEDFRVSAVSPRLYFNNPALRPKLRSPFKDQRYWC